MLCSIVILASFCVLCSQVSQLSWMYQYCQYYWAAFQCVCVCCIVPMQAGCRPSISVFDFVLQCVCYSLYQSWHCCSVKHVCTFPCLLHDVPCFALQLLHCCIAECLARTGDRGHEGVAELSKVSVLKILRLKWDTQNLDNKVGYPTPG